MCLEDKCDRCARVTDEDRTMCPKCDKGLTFWDARAKARTCSRFACDYYERLRE